MRDDRPGRYSTKLHCMHAWWMHNAKFDLHSIYSQSQTVCDSELPNIEWCLKLSWIIEPWPCLCPARLCLCRDKGDNSARLVPHKVSPRLLVPSHVERPPYVDTGKMPWGGKPEVHDAEVESKHKKKMLTTVEAIPFCLDTNYYNWVLSAHSHKSTQSRFLAVFCYPAMLSLETIWLHFAHRSSNPS